MRLVTRIRGQGSLAVVLFIMIIPLLFFPGIINAQDQVVKKNPDTGKWKLMFSYNGNFRLGSFTGSLISLQRQLSKTSVLRFGIGSQSYSNYRTSKYHRISREISSDQHFTNIDFVMNFIKFKETKSNLKPYWGLGSYFAYYRFSGLEFHFDHDDPDFHDKYFHKRPQYDLGLSGLIGIAWDINNHLSFDFEYGYLAYYQLSSREDNHSVSFRNGDYEFDSSIESTEFKFRPTSARFGIALKF